MLWWLLLVVVGALAAPGPLQLDADAWYLDDLVLVQGDEGQLTVEEAYLFRVLDVSREPVGWVAVGPSVAALRFWDPMQAEAVANRRVAAGEDRADAEAMGRGEPWAIGVDVAVLLGAQPLPAGAQQVDGRGAVVVFTSGEAAEEVLVTALPGLAAARRQARTALVDRAEALQERVIDPRAPAVLDGLEPGPDRRWLAALRVDRPDARAWGPGRWLTWAHDPSGVLAPDGAGVVWADTEPRWVLTRWPLAERPGHLAVEGAGILALTTIEPGGQTAETAVAADLRVRAVGGSAQLVVLDLPHTVQSAWGGSPPVPVGFRLAAVTTAEGVPLAVQHLALTPDQREGRGRWRSIVARLPEPLAEGEATMLEVRWSDRRRYAHLLELVGSGGVPRLYLLEVSTGVVPVAPRLRTDGARSAPVSLRVGVQSESTRDTVEVGGHPGARTVADGGYRWVTSRGTLADAVVSVGRLDEGSVPSIAGRPGVEARAQDRANPERTARQVASLVRLLDPIVPTWPARVLVVDGESDVSSEGLPSVQSAAPGVLQVHRWFDGSRARLPSGAALASALILDRWQATPLQGEAVDLAELGSELAGWWALQAAGSRSDRQAWQAEVRASSLGGGALVPPRRLQAHRRWLGSEALPAGYGDAAVQGAFTRVMVEERPRTWSGLAQALSDASGRDAEPFVTLWLASGVRPSVSLQWLHDPVREVVQGTVTTDVPFGGVDVRVRVHGASEVRTVDVQVRDGVGHLQVPWEGEAPRRASVVDDGLPLRGTQVRQQVETAATR